MAPARLPSQCDCSAGKDVRAFGVFQNVRPRTRVLTGLAALLGIATVALPAIASSEPAPTITAVNVTYLKTVSHYWSPASATVDPGGVVTLANPTETPHGVEWVNGPATPSCEGVPVGTTVAASAANWQGACTFATPGVYTFYCTVHGPEMTGTVTVNASGVTTTTTTTGTMTTPAPGSPSLPGAPGSSPGSASPNTTGSGSAGTLGGAAGAVKLARAQHGHVVRGSLRVSPSGAGGRLEVQLLADRAALASTGQQSRVRVGRFVRASVPAGVVHYSAALNARARHALRVRGRLRLSVRILLAPLHGASVSVTRGVTLSS